MLLSDKNKMRILYNEIAAVIGYYRHWPCNTPKNKCEASLRDTLINISLEKNCRHPRLVPGNTENERFKCYSQLLIISRFNIEIWIEESVRENIRSVMLWFEVCGNNQQLLYFWLKSPLPEKVFIQIFTYNILPLSSVYFLHILHIFTSVVNLEAARMSNKCFFVLGGIKLCMP